MLDKISNVLRYICIGCIVILVIVNLTRCGVMQQNQYQFTQSWCANCPKADNYKVFMLHDTIVGEATSFFNVRSVYKPFKTQYTIVCTGTEDGKCISLELWFEGNIYKVIK